MSSVEVRDMTSEDEYFVSTCTHENESEEIDASARRRLAWLRSREPDGLRVKVALVDGVRVGFLYAMPIEVSPWGPLGEDLLALPCLYVLNKAQKRGAGRALMEAAEDEALRQGKKGVATNGYDWEGAAWFMPSSYFAARGYEVAGQRGPVSVMWKPLEPDAVPPRMLEPDYEFEPVPGKVVVDLFWHTFCETCDIEAARVRDVAAEFGDQVVLRDYCGDDRDTLLKHQIPRAIYVQGNEIGWGYEAPRDGIRAAISAALERADGGEA
jgi:GNAT superfamily N-acetyltransferase